MEGKGGSNDVSIRKKGLTSQAQHTIANPVRGSTAFFRFGNRIKQIAHDQVPVSSVFAATKMPLYVLATTSCTPPIREVTTDTSLVQLVTPPDGPSDVICAFIYTREEVLVQWSRPPVSRTEINA